jgi:sulfate permease, SulP family
MNEHWLHRARQALPTSPWSLVPGVRDLRGYDWSTQFRGDLIAGVTVAAVAIPAGLGVGELAGLSPVTGLYATLLPIVGYAIFGSSRQLIVGPDGLLATLTATSIAPIAAGDPALLMPLAGALALLVGGIQIVAGLIRLGFMADFLSKPVLLGYLNGVALTIVASQLPKIFGITIDAKKFFPQIWQVLGRVWHASWQTTVLSAILFAIYFGLKHFAPRIPASLVVVVAAGVASVAFDFKAHGIAVVGDIPSGLPWPRWPRIGITHWSQLTLSAAGLALVAFADAAAISRSYAKKHGYAIDANRELIGLGSANIAAGFTRAFPVAASGSRTAVADGAGGTSQVAALVTAAIAVVVTAFATALIEPLPKAALGVVVVGAALGMLNIRDVVALRRVRDTEAGLAIAAFLGVLTFNVLGGLLLAVGLSIGVYVYRSVRPHDAVLGSIADIDGYHNVETHPAAQTQPGLVIYRFDAAIYFPNAEYFGERVLEIVDQSDVPVRWLVVNVEAVTYIDATAVDTLRELHAKLADRGVTLVIARAKASLRHVLDDTGFTALIGPENFYPTVRTAAEAYISP